VSLLFSLLSSFSLLVISEWLKDGNGKSAQKYWETISLYDYHPFNVLSDYRKLFRSLWVNSMGTLLFEREEEEEERRSPL